MQLHAAGAAGGLPGGLPGGVPGSPATPTLPPGLNGLLGGPGAGPGPGGLPAGLPAGLPTSIALLAGIPTSLAQAGTHPAFASLLAQQKPTPDIPSILRPKDDELKRAIAETNGSKYSGRQTSLQQISDIYFEFLQCAKRVLSCPLFMVNEPCTL